MESKIQRLNFLGINSSKLNPKKVIHRNLTKLVSHKKLLTLFFHRYRCTIFDKFYQTISTKFLWRTLFRTKRQKFQCSWTHSKPKSQNYFSSYGRNESWKKCTRFKSICYGKNTSDERISPNKTNWQQKSALKFVIRAN